MTEYKKREHGSGAKASIPVFVRTVGGRTIVVHVNPDDTIDYFMQNIHLKEGISPDQQILVFAGKQLDSEMTLRDYNIKKNNTIHMTMRLRGGMFQMPLNFVAQGLRDMMIGRTSSMR